MSVLQLGKSLQGVLYPYITGTVSGLIAGCDIPLHHWVTQWSYCRVCFTPIQVGKSVVLFQGVLGPYIVHVDA